MIIKTKKYLINLNQLHIVGRISSTVIEFQFTGEIARIQVTIKSPELVTVAIDKIYNSVGKTEKVDITDLEE